MNRSFLLVALALVCPAILPAQEVRAPFTMDKQYSADMLLTTKDGMSIKAKTFMDGDKMRSESEIGDMRVATIMRKDKNKVYQVMPSQKMVMEMDFDPAKYQGSNAAAFGPEGKFELAGTEVIDGINTTKYKVTSDTPKMEVFYFWLDLAKKVPVKMEAADKSFSVKWKNYKVGPQPPELFEVPAGYQVMAMPAMPNMPGAPGAGGGDSSGGK